MERGGAGSAISLRRRRRWAAVAGGAQMVSWSAFVIWVRVDHSLIYHERKYSGTAGGRPPARRPARVPRACC